MVIRSIESKKLPLPGFEHLTLGFEPMGNSKQDIILQDLVVSCVDLTLVSFISDCFIWNRNEPRNGIGQKKAKNDNLG